MVVVQDARLAIFLIASLNRLTKLAAHEGILACQARTAAPPLSIPVTNQQPLTLLLCLCLSLGLTVHRWTSPRSPAPW